MATRWRSMMLFCLVTVAESKHPSDKFNATKLATLVKKEMDLAKRLNHSIVATERYAKKAPSADAKSVHFRAGGLLSSLKKTWQSLWGDKSKSSAATASQPTPKSAPGAKKSKLPKLQKPATTFDPSQTPSEKKPKKIKKSDTQPPN
eukprot:CAMPEP_0174693822 /NCGR_PEP_ID=MMETSP1094-20130205/462_1 /TAXON_ID=156173 /ORGANISM="Chrysochromulina brevifilum, Strain UTEX LB 985" /LENGTH=146 /DNA_ID=CAMNT_0015889837 /DNA_START=18 /DNA_END=458 /DNA_ORIENTATION=+